MTGIELINIIAPNHSRSSCDDDMTDNGFSFLYDVYGNKTEEIDRDVYPRCKRCALLEIVDGTVTVNYKNNKEEIQFLI